MVQISFTREAGGKPIYLKMFEPQLAELRTALTERQDPINAVTAEGHVHTFKPGVIRSISDRPYDPNTPRRQRHES